VCDLGLILPAKSGFVTPERKKKKEFEKFTTDNISKACTKLSLQNVPVLEIRFVQQKAVARNWAHIVYILVLEPY
jgi:hypothetical protein